MRHGSLFSGIGGFDLAASWMGWENVFQVEKDEWCQRVLAKNFPDTKRHGDIKEFDGTQYRGAIDILSGGFPCQTFSLSGKGEADTSLWEQMFRIAGEIEPKFIVAENVYGLLTQKEGMVFERVCSDLESKGYETQAYLIPACGIGAWHERQRVWFVAHLDRKHGSLPILKRGQDAAGDIDAHRNGKDWAFANTTGVRRVEVEYYDGQGTSTERTIHPTLQRPIDGGVKSGGQSKSGVVRGLYGLPNRVDRIKGLGNAIVPQVAYEIFKAIEMTDSQMRMNRSNG